LGAADLVAAFVSLMAATLPGKASRKCDAFPETS
jgi:hypothetical protein